MSWPVAFTLGAIVGPTDPVAGTAIARRLGVPRRLVSILEGESLINDATALVAYRIAVTAATSAVAFSLLDAGWEFLWKAAGGIAVGLASAGSSPRSAGGSTTRCSRTRSACSAPTPPTSPPSSSTSPAVLAAVTVGVYVGWKAPKIASPPPG